MRTLSMNTFSLKKIVIAVSCTCSVLALSGACALAQAPKSPAPAPVGVEFRCALYRTGKLEFGKAKLVHHAALPNSP